ncbi:MAG: glycosyltransferase, partial [Roseiflexaceae bacterium]|nr:glycosyltransferase [Roseiflexaceae bacterium]
KYLEAAAVGVPTVAVRLDPYRDAITEGVTGLLAATYDEWVTALVRLLRDPALRRRMGEAACADVLGRYTTEHQAARFAQIIEEIAFLRNTDLRGLKRIRTD